MPLLGHVLGEDGEWSIRSCRLGTKHHPSGMVLGLLAATFLIWTPLHRRRPPSLPMPSTPAWRAYGAPRLATTVELFFTSLDFIENIFD